LSVVFRVNARLIQSVMVPHPLLLQAPPQAGLVALRFLVH
jgi:hypothetical protein